MFPSRYLSLLLLIFIVAVFANFGDAQQQQPSPTDLYNLHNIPRQPVFRWHSILDSSYYFTTINLPNSNNCDNDTVVILSNSSNDNEVILASLLSRGYTFEGIAFYSLKIHPYDSPSLTSFPKNSNVSSQRTAETAPLFISGDALDALRLVPIFQMKLTNHSTPRYGVLNKYRLAVKGTYFYSWCLSNGYTIDGNVGFGVQYASSSDFFYFYTLIPNSFQELLFYYNYSNYFDSIVTVIPDAASRSGSVFSGFDLEFSYDDNVVRVPMTPRDMLIPFGINSLLQSVSSSSSTSSSSSSSSMFAASTSNSKSGKISYVSSAFPTSVTNPAVIMNVTPSDARAAMMNSTGPQQFVICRNKNVITSLESTSETVTIGGSAYKSYNDYNEYDWYDYYNNPDNSDYVELYNSPNNQNSTANVTWKVDVAEKFNIFLVNYSMQRRQNNTNSNNNNESDDEVMIHFIENQDDYDVDFYFALEYTRYSSSYYPVPVFSFRVYDANDKNSKQNLGPVLYFTPPIANDGRSVVTLDQKFTNLHKNNNNTNSNNNSINCSRFINVTLQLETRRAYYGAYVYRFFVFAVPRLKTVNALPGIINSNMFPPFYCPLFVSSSFSGCGLHAALNAGSSALVNGGGASPSSNYVYYKNMSTWGTYTSYTGLVGSQSFVSFMMPSNWQKAVPSLVTIEYCSTSSYDWYYNYPPSPNTTVRVSFSKVDFTPFSAIGNNTNQQQQRFYNSTVTTSGILNVNIQENYLPPFFWSNIANTSAGDYGYCADFVMPGAYQLEPDSIINISNFMIDPAATKYDPKKSYSYSRSTIRINRLKIKPAGRQQQADNGGCLVDQSVYAVPTPDSERAVWTPSPPWTYVPQPNPNSNDDGRSSAPKSVLVGSIVGGLVGLIFISVGIAVIVTRMRKASAATERAAAEAAAAAAARPDAETGTEMARAPIPPPPLAVHVPEGGADYTAEQLAAILENVRNTNENFHREAAAAEAMHVDPNERVYYMTAGVGFGGAVIIENEHHHEDEVEEVRVEPVRVPMENADDDEGEHEVDHHDHEGEIVAASGDEVHEREPDYRVERPERYDDDDDDDDREEVKEEEAPKDGTWSPPAEAYDTI